MLQANRLSAVLASICVTAGQLLLATRHRTLLLPHDLGIVRGVAVLSK